LWEFLLSGKADGGGGRQPVWEDNATGRRKDIVVLDVKQY